MKTEERQWVEIFNRIDTMMMKLVASVPDRAEERMGYAEELQQAVIKLGESIEKRKTRVEEFGKDKIYEGDEYILKYDKLVNLLEQYCELIYQYAVDNDPQIGDKLKAKGGEIALAIRFDILVVSREAVLPDLIRERGTYNALRDAGIETGNVYTVSLGTTVCYVKYRNIHLFADTAIVSQGPIDYQNDFTRETMYYYRSLYPNVKLIVSTWKGDVTDEFRWKMEAIGVIIVENVKPSDPGVFNLHMQFGSSRGGIDVAGSDPQIKYILKTRNDQRFYHPDFLQYLRNLLIQYPSGEKAKERLVYLGVINSMITIPFRLADFMLFGNSEMMMRYWSEETEKRCCFEEPVIKEKMDSIMYRRVFKDAKNMAFALTREDRAKLLAEIEGYQDPESKIARTFYDLYFHEDDTENDVLIQYWEWLRDYVVIADTSSMQWYWDKYDYQILWPSVNNSQGDLNYFSWLDLYLNGIPSGK